MEQYVIRGGRAGYDRIRLLARVFHDTTANLLDRAGIGPGMRCLDLGCGSGDVAFHMARRVGPAGFVVGVDRDEEQVELARAEAARLGLANVELRVSDVYAWDEPDSYDLAHARLLLQHLSRPVDVLRAMWAAVRGGGVLVVEDSDFTGQFSMPPNDGFRFWMDAFPRVLVLHGGDPLCGQRMFALFAEAGIPEPEVTVFQRVDIRGEAKRLPYLTIEHTADAIVREGVATAPEVTAALESLAQGIADESTVFGGVRHFQAWVRRPSGG